VFDYISVNRIKDVVFLSGDIHSSWASDLPASDSTYVPATGAGSVATEFIGASVTTSSFIPATPAVVIAANPQLKYVELTRHGFLLLDVNNTRTQGDYIHVSNTNTRTYTTTDDAQWVNLDNERHLRAGSAPLNPASGHNPPLVSPFPSTVGVPMVANNELVVLACYPNPTHNELTLQYNLAVASNLNLALTDVTGKIVWQQTTIVQQPGVHNSALNTSGLPAGTYVLTLHSSRGYYGISVIIGN